MGDEAVSANQTPVADEDRSKAENPERWSGKTRNWGPIQTVSLNPDKYPVVTEETEAKEAA